LVFTAARSKNTNEFRASLAENFVVGFGNVPDCQHCFRPQPHEQHVTQPSPKLVALPKLLASGNAVERQLQRDASLEESSSRQPVYSLAELQRLREVKDQNQYNRSGFIIYCWARLM